VVSAAVLAMPIRVDKPAESLLIDVLAEAEKKGLILITDGRELRYTLPHFPLPDGWTRFIVKVRPRRLDPKAPRA
jgi:hypothetical protein